MKQKYEEPRVDVLACIEEIMQSSGDPYEGDLWGDEW